MRIHGGKQRGENVTDFLMADVTYCRRIVQALMVNSCEPNDTKFYPIAKSLEFHTGVKP